MKTEGLTEKEAWIAMAEGHCVGAQFYPHAIKQGCLLFWSAGEWRPTSYLNKGPYSIVPDPSKPVEEVDEVENQLKGLEQNIQHSDPVMGVVISRIVVCIRALNNKINKLKWDE